MASPKPSNTLDLDLQLAEKVYRSLLPKRLTISGIDVVTRLQAFNRIGGDYATVFPTGDHRVYTCVSDVRAHGISSALLVTRINSFVRERVPSANHPCEIAEELNSFLCENFGELGMSLSFFCGAVDRHRMEFSYAGCGHPPALHFKASAGAECRRLESQHTLLGLFPEVSQQCRIDKVPLDPGDRILLYTDGLTEARNAEGGFFGIDRLARVVGRCMVENLDGELVADRVFAAINRFQGGICRDDALLMMATLQ
jgi:sigma-B regulation protein RsbU (phosphoserine phosphatase)